MKKRRVSSRNFQHCQDIDNLDKKHFCSGCVRWEESSKKKPRVETKTREMQCYQVWKRTIDEVKPAKMKHWMDIQNHLTNELHINVDSLKEIVDESTTTTVENASNTATNDNDNSGPAETPKPVCRNVTWVANEFWCEGGFLSILVPSTHQIEHGKDVGRWRNGYDIYMRIRKKLQGNQFQSTSLFGQALFSIAAASVPALALSAAQFLFPLIVMAMFHDTGLFDGAFNTDKYVKSFPCDTTLRKCNLHQAVRDTILLSNKLRNRKIHIACDKGNKKGIGHFAKAMASYDPYDGIVDIDLLDIDAAGGTSEECANSIAASMNKLKAHDDDDTHLLNGQGTDAGGGGILDSLGEKLHAIDHLCAPANDYLIANCCIHGLQLQLRNSVVTALGDGGLEKVNAMQLIHSVYDLQESIELEVWRHVLWRSCQYIAAFNPATAGTTIPTTKAQECENEFKQKLAALFGFHTKFNTTEVVNLTTAMKYKGTTHCKMTAPMLTRWWTVGAGSSYIFEYYLPLFHAAQTVINAYNSGSGPHGIASCLFAHVSNTDNFIDVALIRGYHKGYITPHLDCSNRALT